MSDFMLYNLAITEDAQTDTVTNQQNQVTTQNAVSGGSSTVTPISSQPNEKTLTAQFRGYRDGVMGEQVRSLFAAGDIEYVPYYGIDDSHNHQSTDEDGIYTLRQNRQAALDPRSENNPQFEGSMQFVGTRRSLWRTVRTKTRQLDNDFGNNLTSLVGIPAESLKVQWWDPSNNDTAKATADSTVTTEHGDVELYDEYTAPYSDPVLLYDLPYDRYARTDPMVYDTQGNANRTGTVDSQTVLQWKKVYHSQYDEEGDFVFDNGLLRLRVDEPGQTMTAEEYSGGSWSAVSLGTESDGSDWQVFDIDITEIACTHVYIQFTFENTVDGSLFRLNGQLNRGYDKMVFHVPPNETGPTPTGLTEVLSPIASGRLLDPQPMTDMVTREEVRY